MCKNIWLTSAYIEEQASQQFFCGLNCPANYRNMFSSCWQLFCVISLEGDKQNMQDDVLKQATKYEIWKRILIMFSECVYLGLVLKTISLQMIPSFTHFYQIYLKLKLQPRVMNECKFKE